MQGKPYHRSPQPLTQGSSKVQVSRQSQLQYRLRTLQQQPLLLAQQLVLQRLALTIWWCLLPSCSSRQTLAKLQRLRLSRTMR
jgi:hypothetical protein